MLRMHMCVGAILVLWVSSGLVRAEVTCTTTVPAGSVAGETWTSDGSPYCVQGNILVSLLTIRPGVEVYAEVGVQIDVVTSITVLGTVEQPILFSEFQVDGGWNGIKFSDVGCGSILKYATIEFSHDAAISIDNSCAPVLEHLVIRNNSKAGSGGGIEAVDVMSDLAIVDSTFENNTATVHGGALRVAMGTGFKLLISRSNFTANVANPSHATGNSVGGALYLTQGAADISNSQFIDNRSNSQCSGVFGCHVTGRGGALYLDGGDMVEIHLSEFDGNQSDALNQGNCFHGGSSHAFGGAYYVNSGTVSATNSILACNQTTASNCSRDLGGAGMFVNTGGSAGLENVTIVHNSSSTGIRVEGAGILDAVNSIVWDNNGGGTQISGTPVVTYSDVQNGFDGEGNIRRSPDHSRFVATFADFSDLASRRL